MAWCVAAERAGNTRSARWARLGSNQRPSDYESPALTTELQARRAPGERLELSTRRINSPLLCRLSYPGRDGRPYQRPLAVPKPLAHGLWRELSHMWRSSRHRRERRAAPQPICHGAVTASAYPSNDGAATGGIGRRLALDRRRIGHPDRIDDDSDSSSGSSRGGSGPVALPVRPSSNWRARRPR